MSEKYPDYRIKFVFGLASPSRAYTSFPKPFNRPRGIYSPPM